jgi:hypothetical protein
VLRCITYDLQVTCTHKRPSVPHVDLQEYAHCKYRTRQVSVTKSMDAATAETIDQSGDTAGGCHFHSLCLRFISVARVRSGFVLIALASGYRIGVGRYSRPHGAVGVLAMPGAGLDTMRRIESVCKDPLGVGVL